MHAIALWLIGGLAFVAVAIVVGALWPCKHDWLYDPDFDPRRTIRYCQACLRSEVWDDQKGEWLPGGER